MRQWRLIYDCPTSGADNMAIDEAILEAVSAEVVPPTLRLYGWAPACLSLGYGQRVHDVDFERAIALGWDVVRRPTGGRAILHTDELTYSLSLPADDPIARANIIESYRWISAALMNGLNRLGIQPQADKRAPPETIKPVCFETPSHYEITVEGRKLVGSAQLRRKNGLLQHGSLPLYGDIARICDVLVYPDEASREAAKARVQERAITLSQALSAPYPEIDEIRLDWQTTAAAIAQGFAETFQVEFSSSNAPTSGELERAETLASGLYASESWTYRR